MNIVIQITKNVKLVIPPIAEFYTIGGYNSQVFESVDPDLATRVIDVCNELRLGKSITETHIQETLLHAALMFDDDPTATPVFTAVLPIEHVRVQDCASQM